MPEWVNFKQLRQQLPFVNVLRHFGVEIKTKKPNQHAGPCPLPGHGGKRESPCFSANLEKGIFQCFGCHAKGNSLDFAALMLGFDPKNGETLREAALLIREKMLGVAPPMVREPIREMRVVEPPAPTQVSSNPVQINAPLDFTLKGLDAEHPYLKGRRFTAATIQSFGLGFCARGYLKDRIAIPLHDDEGRLVGYAGRLVDDSLISRECPKYLLPSKRERNGTIFEFQKSLFLYGGSRLKSSVEQLIVVEGFPALWWLHQAGIANVVSTMGASCSDEQASLTVQKTTETGVVWVFSDGDDAGQRHASDVLLRIAPHRNVRLIRSPTKKQPTDFSPKELHMLFARPERKETQNVSTSIKKRLESKTLTVREAIIELIRSLTALRFLTMTAETWDAGELDGLSGKLSSTEKTCVQFVLHVWNFRGSWNTGTFDIGRLDTLDRDHRRVFAEWAADPWWC